MVRHALVPYEIDEPTFTDAEHSPLPRETMRALTEAVAQELHKIHGGNEVLDWLEAEMLVEGVLERAILDRT